MNKLNEMTLKELSPIALDLGLTLSYKSEDGKRKRYTKPQLIEMIEAKRTEKFEVVETTVQVEESAPVTIEAVETVETCIIETTPVTNVKVVKVASEQLEAGNFDIVKGLLQKLNNYINSERKNKLLVSNMSNWYKLINSKLKMYNRKVAAHG